MASSGRLELPSHWERDWDVAFVSAQLAPFAVADALSSNKVAEPQEISISAPAPHPPLSLTN